MTGESISINQRRLKLKNELHEKIRKLKKNAKALSPVVASIILIAVTVAVSVVVAAWMGGMTIGFMGSAEQVSITNVAICQMPTQFIMVQNARQEPSINHIAHSSTEYSNNHCTTSYQSKQATQSQNSTEQLHLYSAGANNPFPLIPGTSYTVKLITAKGTSVVSTAATYSP